MAEMSDEDLKHLEMKVKFYLNSSVRAQAEIERLDLAVANAHRDMALQAESHRRQRLHWHKQGLKQTQRWDNVKAILADLRSKNQALEDELQSVYDSIVEQMDDVRSEATLETQVNPEGVWETTPPEVKP